MQKRARSPLFFMSDNVVRLVIPYDKTAHQQGVSDARAFLTRELHLNELRESDQHHPTYHSTSAKSDSACSIGWSGLSSEGCRQSLLCQ